MNDIHVVLFEPQIPQNTGNVARTCAATGAVLHLIHPLGFAIDDKKLKRAGLDYWHLLDVRHHADWAAFERAHPEARAFFLSTKAEKCYAEEDLSEGAVFLVFGPETSGLPAALLARHPARALRIPMRAGARSLNLSNSVALTVYEALRQRSFHGLSPRARGEPPPGTGPPNIGIGE